MSLILIVLINNTSEIESKLSRTNAVVFDIVSGKEQNFFFLLVFQRLSKKNNLTVYSNKSRNYNVQVSYYHGLLLFHQYPCSPFLINLKKVCILNSIEYDTIKKFKTIVYPKRRKNILVRYNFFSLRDKK